MKKLFLFFIGILLIIVIALAAAYVFRAPLMQSAGPLIADQLGVEIAELDIETIGLRQIVIPRFRGTYFAPGKILDVMVDQLTVQIDPWAGKRDAIKSVSVKNIELTINTSNDSAVESETEARAIDVIRGLPPALIAIERMVLTYQYAPEKVLLYQGSITRDQNQLKTTGTLLMPGYIQSNVLLASNLLSSFDLNITSLKSDGDQLDFSGEFSLQDHWIYLSGNGDVSISAVETYLERLELKLPFKLINVDSNFELTMEADLGLPVNRIVQSMATKLDLRADTQLRLPDYELEQVDLGLHTECIIESVSIADCRFRQPINAEFEFARAPVWVTENFDWSENRFTAEINPANEVALRLELNDNFSYQAKGDMRVTARAKNAPLSIDASISDMALNADDNAWELDSMLEVKLDANKIKTPVQMQRAVVSMRGSMRGTSERIDMQVLKNTRVIAQNIKSPNVEINKIELAQANNANVSYEFATDLLNGSNLNYLIQAVRMNNENAQLEFEESRLAIKKLQRKNNDWHVAARMDVNKIKAVRANRTMEFHSVGTDLQLSGDQVEVHGEVGVGQGNAPLKIVGKHHLDEQAGSVVVTMDAFGLTQNEMIKAIIATTGLPLQLKQGSLSTRITASWDDIEQFDPVAEIQLKAESVAGDYAQNQFEGLNTEIQVNGSQNRFVTQPIAVTIDNVNIGVPITNISFGFDRIEKAENKLPVIQLNEFSAKLLDGSIYAKEIEMDLNRAVNEFSIYLFNLSLQQLLALNQTEDLIASGRFNGELPMRIQSEDFSIQAGWIKADEQGGVIKYDRIDEVLVGNPNLELVADLLKDFRYNEMSAQIDLQPDGNILLATKLHGRSPNSEFDKQVNLNFNIEFNLWKFLESARLLTRIDQDISEQIISRQRNK